MNEHAAVRELGDAIGYGRMMQLAQEIWRSKLESQGIAGGEFACGPCVALTVVCTHPELDSNGHCEWCCGSGWLTKRVARAAKVGV